MGDWLILICTIWKDNDETYSFLAGEMGSFDSEPNVQLKKSKNDINSSIEEIRPEINAICARCKSLILSEVTKVK